LVATARFELATPSL